MDDRHVGADLRLRNWVVALDVDLQPVLEETAVGEQRPPSRPERAGHLGRDRQDGVQEIRDMPGNADAWEMDIGSCSGWGNCYGVAGGREGKK